MNLLWPGLLIFLGLIPLQIAIYVWMLRRKRRFTVRYSSLSLVRDALPKQSRWRRHVPFALFLVALTSLVIALGRPFAISVVPSSQTTVILAIDVSLSMRQNDIEPSRLEAAEAAAKSFIQKQKANTQIGIVAFSGFAELIQPPTTDQEALQSAVESLTLGRRTAIGSGILKSIDAIAEIDSSVTASNETNTGPPPTPVLKGAYAPDVIVVLTDGVSNAGPLPLDAAQQAADRGVRIYTIGYGTEKGEAGFPFGGRQPQGNDPGSGSRGSNDPFGGGQGFGGGFRRGIDEKTLKAIADLTGGDYYAASSASELQEVFKSLPTYLITRHETTEISVYFAAVGALFAALAVALSLLWHPIF